MRAEAEREPAQDPATERDRIGGEVGAHWFPAVDGGQAVEVGDVGGDQTGGTGEVGYHVGAECLDALPEALLPAGDEAVAVEDRDPDGGGGIVGQLLLYRG